MRQPKWARRQNKLKAMLREGRPATSIFATVPWPPIIEIIGAVGVNAVVLDLEHVSYGLDDLQNNAIAAEAADVTSIVRLQEISPTMVTRILDSGVQGVMFPMVNDPETATLAKSCLRYPPHGIRGWGGAHTRHAMWQGISAGSTFDTVGEPIKGIYSEDYIAKAEGDLVIVYLVESVRGVENIEAILDVGGMDLVMFGLGDYSAEVRFDKARCDAAGKRVYDACKRRGIGLLMPYTESAAAGFYSGCMYNLGVDALLLNEVISKKAAEVEARLAQITR